MPRLKEPIALTPDLVALVERLEPDPGPEPGRHDPSDAEFAQMAAKVLDGAPDGDLWLFAYGSLIWNPGHDFVEHSRAIALGWHRSFCLTLTRWRGTREVPALMMALDRGGSCTGIAYQLPPGDRLRRSASSGVSSSSAVRRRTRSTFRPKRVLMMSPLLAADRDRGGSGARAHPSPVPASGTIRPAPACRASRRR